ncbi:hypothetical protein Btru_063777 [Bulinus truncatus]|nr:hypothetical protein Btru_063777 [Bulinus truncatus]
MEPTKYALCVLNVITLLVEFGASVGNHDECSECIRLHTSPVNLGDFGINEERLASKQDDIFDVGWHELHANSNSSNIKIVTSQSGCKCSDIICDCTSLQLHAVPDNLPSTIQVLNLSNNYITDLPQCSFCIYTELRSLNLSTNKITKLHVDSFIKMGQLISIDLSNNFLQYNLETFPPGVFQDLKSLKYLKMNKNSDPSNCDDCYYPDRALADLTNVTDLFLDGLENPQLGPGFNQMTSLRKLTFAGGLEGFCNMVTLKNDTFQNVSQIQALALRNCNLNGSEVETGALLPLRDMRGLDISYNPQFGMYAFRKMVGCISYYNVTVLKANYIRSMYADQLAINETIVKSLPRALTHLEAAGNNFYRAKTKTLQILPSNLTYLFLRNNQFTYGVYMTNIKSMKNLETIILSGGESLDVFPDSLNLNKFNRYRVSEDNAIIQEKYFFQLPPKTSRIDLSVYSIKYILGNISVDPNNSLKYLDLSRNYLPVLLGPITGLHSLESLNLSHNSVYNISDDFFMDFPSLKELILSENLLGGFYSRSKGKVKVFRHLKQLTRLSLSTNSFTKVHRNILEGLNSLEELIMDKSSMWHFNISISHMPNLRLLNLSHGQIRELPDDVRSHIDNLTSDPTREVTVDLSYNPIHCECQYVEMIQWMVKSRAFDPKFQNYMCQYPDGSYKMIDDSYEETLSYLSHACADNYPTFLFVIVGTFLMILTVLGGIIYRFRWDLRYFYYAAYLKFKVGRKAQDSKTYSYDVFVSYAHQDEMFVVHQLTPALTQRGLQLCLHGRDFVAGSYIASNILNAVKESRKTLVVLTKNFMDSQWCIQELQMANMETVHTGRQVLVFLIKDRLSSHDLTPDLSYHVSNNTYIEYPDLQGQGERSLRVFWDKLKKDLKS